MKGFLSLYESQEKGLGAEDDREAEDGDKKTVNLFLCILKC